jgi:tetratricopeptide (TPR) repeat protein
MRLALFSYLSAEKIAPSDIRTSEWLGDFFALNYFEDDKNETLSELKDAQKYYEQVLEYSPLSWQIYYKIGILHSNRSDSRKAIEWFQSALKENNGSIPAMTEMALEYAKIGDKTNSLKYCCMAISGSMCEFEKIEEEIKECLT